MMINKDNYKGDLRYIFEKVLKEKGLNQTQLAQELNLVQQNLNLKIRNATMQYTEVVAILAHLGYGLQLVPLEDATSRTQDSLMDLHALIDKAVKEQIEKYMKEQSKGK